MNCDKRKQSIHVSLSFRTPPVRFFSEINFPNRYQRLTIADAFVTLQFTFSVKLQILCGAQIKYL